MSRIEDIAEEISILMPMIARRVLSEFFQTVDITQTQIFAIITLYEKAPCRLSELGTRMNVSAPTVTGIVDRLEKSGYVKRIPDDEDRRAINVDLTPEGVKIAKTLRATIKDKWQEILSKLSSEDRETYLNIVRKIQGSL